MEPSRSTPSWGKTVEMLRRLRDWRQEELAERARLSLSTLSYYEKGRKEPSDDLRAAVEKALGVAGWMDEAQALLGYLRRAMERPVDFGATLEQEAAERAAQVEILLRAGMARLQGGENSDHDPQNSSHAEENSDNGRRGSSHGRKNSGNGVRNSPRSQKNSAPGPQNSSRGPKNSGKGPRNSSRAPKNSAHGS